MCILYQNKFLPQSFSFAFKAIAIRSKNFTYPLVFSKRITQHASAVSMGGNGAFGDFRRTLVVNKLTFSNLRGRLSREQGNIFRRVHKPVDNS
jgi:hypothetical protein